MSILDILKEYNSKKRYYTEKSEAEQHFINQKKAIDGIKNKDGFKEIREYWQRVVLACNERLRTIRSEDIKMIQGELNAAMDFLNFLDNVIADDLDKEDLDILNSN